ncbi:DNA-directed RNA polymerase III subunit RPC3 [Mortierella alpina]|nr:DNA-directed RNA polymerase III subunit RPC3 [Mortierella alpina]
MSTHENRLCRLIVREHFGPIVEKVANVLIRKGRMPAGMIAHMTQLKIRQVRECLFVLIQHNVAVYAETQEKTRIVTYYEINRSELLHRAMVPKVLGYAKEWFGKDGLKIAQSMVAHGKQTIVDCMADILADQEMRSNKDTRSAAVKWAFTNMVKEKILIAVRPSDSLTAADKAMAEEKRETDKMTLPPTAAELATIRRTLGAQKTALDQRYDIVGLKRTVNEAGHDDFIMEKRRKTDAQELVLTEEVETDVYFKINFERFTIRWRNMVYRMLPEDLNVGDTLELMPGELVVPRLEDKAGKIRFHNECLDKYMEVLEGDLMQLLKKDVGRSGQYVVDLKKAARTLKRKLIQDVVMTRFGAPYVRIMNLLLDKGKLEEKQISRLSMLPVKTVREKLTTLHTFGVLSLQEVPKTTDRTPSRTFYLWEVLLDRAADSMAEKLYQTMANLRQRRFAEKMKRQVLLDKCERTDVKENKDLLNSAERKELDSLNGIMELLEVQELRVAEMVVTLRDY